MKHSDSCWINSRKNSMTQLNKSIKSPVSSFKFEEWIKAVNKNYDRIRINFEGFDKILDKLKLTGKSIIYSNGGLKRIKL